MANPLIADSEIEFLLSEVFDLDRILRLPAFASHHRETAVMYIDSARKLARDVLFPTYEELNHSTPVFEDGVLRIHPAMHALFPRMVELGVITASRPETVGGAQLPMTVASLANAYLMAGNAAAHGYMLLTTGAARLIESFGSDELKSRFMTPMYEGRWTGTMALTEPQAGSSLSDVRTTASPIGDHYRIKGTKIFISGGSHDLTENIVHLTLARIEGAPPGIKGVSLFAIPTKREEAGQLVGNDVNTTGSVRKIGWKAIPSVVLDFGDRDDCHGWLVGEPHCGIRYMFQMMNEARLNIGLTGVATAMVAYRQSLIYANERPQGRPPSAKDPSSPQVPIIQHQDVRRMLLRQKAIVEGGLALLIETAYLADLAEHGEDEATRKNAFLLLDLLTPVAKTFPAEYGFEVNTLAIQIHGGYGYSSEYLPESWWRDQKLNSLHEGTSGIQAMDLLGRKVMAGRAFELFADRVQSDLAESESRGTSAELVGSLRSALGELARVTRELALRGGAEGAESMLRHASDYMTLFSLVAVGWMWLRRDRAARSGLDKLASRVSDLSTSAAMRSAERRSFYEGQHRAALYWARTELVRVPELAERCRSGETSFSEMVPDWY